MVVIVLGGAAAGWFAANSGGRATTPPVALHTSASPTGPPSREAAVLANPDAAKARITRMWETFFASSTPVKQKIPLLQHGDEFASAVRSLSMSLLAHDVEARPLAITLQGTTKATVLYNLLQHGTTALTNEKGTAVLVGGEWKVSDAAFCRLLDFAGQSPSACKSVASATPAGG